MPSIVTRIFGCGGLLVSTFACGADAAQTSAQKLRGLGLADSGSATPSLLRVLLVFVLVAGLAWGVTWLMKRYGLRLPGSAAAPGKAGIRVLSRAALPGGVTCHLVEAQGREVLITVTRQGVASLLLGDAAPPENKT